MIIEVASTASGEEWFVHHCPRATTDTDPPEPDYLSFGLFRFPSVHTR